MSKPSTDPLELDIESPTSPLRILWDDGHESLYDLEHLRRLCPCAQCTQHGATPLEVRLTRPLPDGAFEVKAIEEVGSYALRVTWKDGHDAGFFSFQHLRDICPCRLCVGDPVVLEV